jgi:hypothetical protein
MKSKVEALSDARQKRAKVEETLAAIRARLTVPQLAEDAMNFVDPDLALLGRIRVGVRQNRLLSLAVLAGAGWLVGSSRRSIGEPRNMRRTDTATIRTMKKENKNDSGQSNRNKWTGSGRQSPGIAKQKYDTGHEQGRKHEAVIEQGRHGAESGFSQERSQAQRIGKFGTSGSDSQPEPQRQEERW